MALIKQSGAIAIASKHFSFCSPASFLSPVSSLLFLGAIAAFPNIANATTLSGFSTTGSMMDGMRITVNFLDGGSQTAIWRDTDSLSGSAIGNNWFLRASGNTFYDPWTFQNSSSRPITSLHIDAISGNALFDIFDYGPGLPHTIGSANGHPFTVVYGRSPNSHVFTDPIDISQGDLFGGLSLFWHSGFWGQMAFIADTDNGIPSDPVAPKNIAPTLTGFNVATIQEGQSASAALSATDPNSDSITFLLNGNAVATDSEVAGTRSANVNLGHFTDNGSVTYTAQAQDSSGNRSNSITRTLIIQNVAPTLTGLNLPNTILEGQSASAILSATDPGADAISFFLNGQTIGTDGRTSGTRSASRNLGTFTDNGTFQYLGQARDKDGAYSQTINRTLTVLNVAPTLANFALSNNVILEGQSASAYFSATDPGADAISFFLNGQTIGTDGRTSGTRSGSTNLGTFTDEGTFSYTGQAIDKDGGSSQTQTQQLTVLNVAPTITNLTQNLTISEGSWFDFAAEAIDPGINDILSFDWDMDGDGIFDDFIGQSGRWSYADDGFNPITLQVSDGDGGFDWQSFNVTVANVAPTITNLTSDLTVFQDEWFDFMAEAVDPGINDLLQFDWDMNGDGIFDDFIGQTGQWSYADDGLFTVGLRVSDGDGGVAFASLNVTVERVPEPNTVLGLIGLGFLGLKTWKKRERS
jgi:hypothetical protein